MWIQKLEFYIFLNLIWVSNCHLHAWMSLICSCLHISNHKVWQVFLSEIFGELGIQVGPIVQGTVFLSASENIQTDIRTYLLRKKWQRTNGNEHSNIFVHPDLNMHKCLILFASYLSTKWIFEIMNIPLCWYSNKVPFFTGTFMLISVRFMISATTNNLSRIECNIWAWMETNKLAVMSLRTAKAIGFGRDRASWGQIWAH